LSVVDAFLATWSDARATFGQGAPDTGAKFDKSGPLLTMQANVQSAAPGSTWSGTAASAYGTANTEHGAVLGKIAGLDQRLGAQVDQSSQVVAAGRRDLDALRQWVIDAAAAVPPGKNRDQTLLPIAQKGLSQLTEIVSKCNGDLGKIGGEIRNLDAEFRALANQRFVKEGAGDGALGATGDEPGDGVPPPVDPARAEHDVQRVLAGTATPEELARVRAGLTLSPEQQTAYDGGQHVGLDGQQKQILGQMQAQMHGMSINDIRKAEQRLADDKNLIPDAMQMMSSSQFDYAKVPLEVDAPGSLTETARGGSVDQLPKSVTDVLSQQAQVTKTDYTSGFPVTLTEYPTKDDLHTLAGIVQDGHQSVQQGTYLDRALLDRGAEILSGEEIQKTNPGMVVSNHEHVDPTVQDIFKAAGRDTIASHDLLTNTSTDPITGGPHGEAVLQNISRHDWADDGAGARTMTDWIDDAANSGNERLETRAGETARAVANYLGNPDNGLLHLQEHPAGLSPGSISIGEQNPSLVQGYAEALIPFQGDMVGENHSPGFHPIEDPSGSDMPKTRALFAVMDSDPTAANDFNAHAYDKVVEFQQQFAQLAGENPNFDIADQRSQGMARAGLLAGLIDGGAFTEASARQSDGLAAAESAYELKKNALGYMVGLGADKLPFVGGLADAMGKDALVESLLGGKPSIDMIDGTPHVNTHGDQYYDNLARYTISSSLVHNNPTGFLPPAQWLNPDGQLMTPEQVLTDPNLGSDHIDDYYNNLYSYLAKPENHNLAQYLDEFNSQFGNGTKK
jgi:hypothetical protein